jgi:hypothetical protein
VRLSIWCVTPRISAFLPASLKTRKRKLLVLIAVPRAEGKMKASGAASLEDDLHHSTSVSMETGTQTFVLLPSVFVSTSMPSVMHRGATDLQAARACHRQICRVHNPTQVVDCQAEREQFAIGEAVGISH